MVSQGAEVSCVAEVPEEQGQRATRGESRRTKALSQSSGDVTTAFGGRLANRGSAAGDVHEDRGGDSKGLNWSKLADGKGQAKRRRECYLCGGPHWVRECPERSKLVAIIDAAEQRPQGGDELQVAEQHTPGGEVHLDAERVISPAGATTEDECIHFEGRGVCHEAPSELAAGEVLTSRQRAGADGRGSDCVGERESGRATGVVEGHTAREQVKSQYARGELVGAEHGLQRKRVVGRTTWDGARTRARQANRRTLTRASRASVGEDVTTRAFGRRKSRKRRRKSRKRRRKLWGLQSGQGVNTCCTAQSQGVDTLSASRIAWKQVCAGNGLAAADVGCWVQGQAWGGAGPCI